MPRALVVATVLLFAGHARALTVITGDSDAPVTWSDSARWDLTYCVSIEFGGAHDLVVQAMTLAAEEGWEKVAGVNFQYVPVHNGDCHPGNARVSFDVRPGVLAPGEPQSTARSFFPDTPREGRSLLIFPGAYAKPDGIELYQFVMHELGHVIGFRHEHSRRDTLPEGCSREGYPSGFHDLTDYDPTSVMHYRDCGSPSGSPLVLSALDREAAPAVYPPGENLAPIAGVSSPEPGWELPPTFTVRALVKDMDATVAELYIDDADAPYQTLRTPPFDYVITDLAPGAHSLRFRAVDSIGQTDEVPIPIRVSIDASTEVTGGCRSGGGQGGWAAVLMLGFVMHRRRRSGIHRP